MSSVSEHARFAIRGVIEGFYGPPWTHQERLDMIDFLGRCGFNTYIYSPKEDPSLRDRWIQPHSQQELEQIREWANAASMQGIAFVYALSPGFGMEYANEAHLRSLADKFYSLYMLGVRQFALMYDDIPLQLMHQIDQEAFSHLAEAHAATASWIWEEISTWPETGKLLVCPTQYSGMGDEPYISYLGRHLPRPVELFSTGRFVCSPYLTSQDAMRFLTYTQRRPLYWDNYPVNDLAMANELHIGPLRNRDHDLCNYAAGYVANAMSRSECSKIPLMTAAEYLQHPEGYQADDSWERAIAAVVGNEQAAAFRRFAEHVQGSFLNDKESPRLLDDLLQFRFHFLQGSRQQAQALIELNKRFVEMESTADELLYGLSNRKLLEECRPWIEKYRIWGMVGQAAVSLIEAGIHGKMVQAALHLLRLKRLVKRAEAMPQKVCGNVMSMFVDNVLQEVKKSKQ